MREVELFEGSDIALHFPRLAELAKECDSLVELGVRGCESTKVFIENVQKRLLSVDIVKCDVKAVREVAKEREVEFTFLQCDSRSLRLREVVDGLFIDTFHSYNVLTRELELHAPLTQKWIAMHDTYLFGDEGEDGTTPGLWQAVQDFLDRSPEWKLQEHYDDCNGLTILRRK